MSTTIAATLKAELSDDIDDELVDYLCSMVSDMSAADRADVDALEETIAPFLISAGHCEDDDAARAACARLATNFGAGGDAAAASAAADDAAPRLLSAPVTFGGVDGGDSDWFGDAAAREKANRSINELRDQSVVINAKDARRARQELERARRAYEAQMEEEAAAEADADKISSMLLPDYRGGDNSRDILVPRVTLALANGRRLLDDAELRLVYGRRYGLVGPNGIGKTTLLKAMAAWEIEGVPRHHRVLHVRQEVRGSERTVLQTVLEADSERSALRDEERAINERLNAGGGGGGAAKPDAAAAAADPAFDADCKRLDAIYARLAAIGDASAEARAASILAGLQFSPAMQAGPTSALSGGWRMRVSLAGALFIAPDVLLLDEPTNHLDLEAVLWLGQYLLTYPHTLVLVSHDRAFLDEVTTDTINFHDQKLLNYRGSHEVFVRTAEDHAKQQRREYDAYVEKRAHMQEFIDKFRCSASRASLVQSRVKAVEKMAAEAPDEPPQPPAPFRFVIPSPDAIGRPVISVEDVSFDYPLADPEASPSPPPADGAAPPPPPPPLPAPPRMRPQAEWLLRKANFPVDLESRVGIVGVNGAGKSTLLNLIMEQLKPLEGQVRRNPRCRVGHFSQHAAEKFDLQKSALENLLAMNPETLSEQECRNLAGRFQIRDQDALKPMQMLSGGQKSRVAFASLVAAKPHVIIMDEPTNHLDFESIDALIVALSDFKGGLVVVSHDQHFITSTCTEIWSVEGGAVSRMRGTFDDYKKAALKRTQAAVAASVKRLVSTR